MASGPISAFQIIPIVEALEYYGADADGVLDRARIGREQLADRSTRLDPMAEHRVWAAAVELTGEEQLGLRLAPGIKQGVLGAYEYLLRNSATIGETIEMADRYMRVVDARTRIGVRIEDGQAVMAVSRHDGSKFIPIGVECLFAVIALLVKDELPHARITEIRFAHERIGDLATYAEVFDCELRFGGLSYELVFPAQMLEARLPHADPALGRVLEEHVQQLLDAMPPVDPAVERARRRLAELLPTGSFGLDELASDLHLSPRTLRRRLEEHGTSYKALLEDLRREMAAVYVGRTDEAFEDVARRLGFSDPSTFYRAFKRWTSLTPAQYRKKGPTR